MLGDFEYQVLSSIVSCGRDAYGSPVKAEIESSYNRSVAYGALYTTLSRLEKKGYIKSTIQAATAVRGGRRKKFFQVTGLGQTQMREKRNFAERLASPVSLGGLNV